MKVYAYKPGSSAMQQLPVEPRPIDNERRVQTVFLDVVLDDERQVRLTVDSDGRVWVRTWGTTPIRLGNGTQSSLQFIIEKQEPNHDEHGCPLPSLREKS